VFVFLLEALLIVDAVAIANQLAKEDDRDGKIINR
jgi:hypothetical protein